MKIPKRQEKMASMRYTVDSKLKEDASVKILFKRGASLLLAVVFLLLLVPQVRAAGSYALVVNTNRLNIRSGPGMDYPIIGGVDRGQWVELNTSSGAWLQGRSMQNNLVGYFSASFLKLAQPSGGSGSTAVVNNPNPSAFLNLREYPSYTAPVLAIFYNGATCTILGENNGWYLVDIAGMRGYFRSEYLRVSGGASSIGTARVYSPNGGRVNLRSGPSLNTSVLTSLAPGSTVTVYLKGSRFWYISQGGTFGFMDASFLGGGSTGAGPQPNPPIVTPESTNAIVTSRSQSLNLREQPTTGSKVLGSFRGPTAVRVLMQGSQWSRVMIPITGQNGYMMTRYLTLYGLPVTPSRRVSHPKGTFVNLRTRPSMSGGVTLRVPHGKTVNILVAGGDWAKVQYGGYTGYMMTAFLK